MLKSNYIFGTKQRIYEQDPQLCNGAISSCFSQSPTSARKKIVDSRRQQENDEIFCVSEDDRENEEMNAIDETTGENKCISYIEVLEENIKMKKEVRMYKKLYKQQVIMKAL